MDSVIKAESVEGFPVDARKLHEDLQVKSRFNDWIKYKLVKLNLGVGEDYQKVGTKGSKS